MKSHFAFIGKSELKIPACKVTAFIFSMAAFGAYAAPNSSAHRNAAPKANAFSNSAPQSGRDESFTRAKTLAANMKLPPGVKLERVGAAISGTPDVYKFTFPNGMRLMVLPDSRNPLGTLRVKLDGGSNREVLGKTGLAHFFEHMMFRKTKATDEGHYDRTLAGIGGNGNAGTSTDYVVYESAFPGPALEKMLELEAQRFTALDLTDPYFTTEKGAVISERRLRYENDPGQRASELINFQVEKGTPYEWFTIGAKQDVENMSIPAAMEFYKNIYAPDNSLMTIGGPYNPEQVVALVNKYFTKWTAKSNPDRLKSPDDYNTRNLGKKFICGEDVTEGKYQIIFPSTDTSYKSSVMTMVFSHMLNDHPEGQFTRRLLKNKLATGFGIYKVSYKKTNPPNIAYFKLNRDQKFAELEKFWWKSVQEVLKKSFDANAKKAILKQVAVDEAETAQKMTTLVETYEWSEFFYNDFLADKQVANIVNNLTEAEFRSWVLANLDPKKSFITGVVPTQIAPKCTAVATQGNTPSTGTESLKK